MNDQSGNAMDRVSSLEGEARYRTLIALAADGILIGNHEGVIMEANDQMCAILGMPREAFVGRHIGEALFTRTSLEAVPLRFDLLKEGEVVVSERAFVRPDGAEVVVEMRSKMMPDGSYQSIYRDITARKKAELALRESEEKYRQFVQCSHEGVSLVDEEGVVIIWNESNEEISGIPASSAIGRRVWDVMYDLLPAETKTPEQRAHLKAKAERALATGELAFEGVREVESTRADGTTVYSEQTAFAIKTAKGYQMGSVCRDITESKKLLEHALQSQKLESLSVLAGGIAHDFNNILSGVFGYIDLARTTNLSVEASRYLSLAMGAIDRARGLTRQLLTFSKGGAPIKKIGPLMPFVEDAIRFALSGSTISCAFDVAEDLWPCSFDHNQMAQVIDNLTRNAQQAMPMGGRIDVSLRNIESGDRAHVALGKTHHVAISITDAGIGIPKEILPRIFDPFFTTKEQGHGLGLAACYSIVAQHGGAIAVASAQGKGSTFTVYLPAVDMPENTISRSDVKMHSGAGRMLVMDDEALVRDILSALLSKLGYEVAVARDGEEAIALFRTASAANRPFDGVFLDLTVPGGMGGEEAAAALRALDENVPIFMSSGYADAPIMAAPKAHGFSDSLSKPFSMRELSALLDRHMPSKR